MLVRGLFALILCSLSLSAHADVYTVRQVAVDRTAASAAIARDEALLDGQRLAARQLLERLTLKENHDKLPRLTDNAIRDLVAFVNIEQEKTSGVRYVGTIAVGFHPDRIRRLLRQKNLSFTETASRPLLVLPLWQDGQSRVLWGDNNPWLSAWQNTSGESVFTPYAVPLGDGSDIATLRLSDLDGGSLDALLRLAEKYQTNEALVVTAMPRSGTLTIKMERVSRQQRLPPQTITVTSNAGEALPAMLDRAVTQVNEAIEEAWKKRNIVRPDAVGVVTIAAPVASAADWAVLEQRLRAVSLVQTVRPVYIDANEVRAQIEFGGHIEQFQVAAEQQGLSLQEKPPFWVLRVE